jgi:hypothetical protein
MNVRIRRWQICVDLACVHTHLLQRTVKDGWGDVCACVQFNRVVSVFQIRVHAMCKLVCNQAEMYTPVHLGIASGRNGYVTR